MAGQSHYQSQVHFLCCFGFLLGLQRPSEATPPPGHLAKPDIDLSPPKYEFGYEVRDDKGGQQGHLEARDGVYALGKYYVKLPDGSDQKVNYFTDDWGYHPLVEYNSASPSGSSRTQFAMGEKAVAALVKSISNVKTTHDFDSAQKLDDKKKEISGKLDAEVKNTKPSFKPGSSVYIGLASTPGIANDIHVESSTPTPHISSTQSNQYSSSASDESNYEEDLYAFTEPTLAPHTVSTVLPPQGSLLMHTINLEGGGGSRISSSAHQTTSDFGMKLEKNPLSTYLNIHSHKFSSTSQPVTSNYVEESVEDVTQRVFTTVGGEISSKSTEQEIVQQTSPTVATITTLHTNPYSIINVKGVDVSPNGEDSRSQELNSFATQPTTIYSTTTTDNSKHESELRYTVSTTPSPTTLDDSFIRPIVVPDGPFEMQSFYSGLLRTTEEMKNFIANLNRTLIANEEVSGQGNKEQYKSTPSPIKHADLASSEEENSFHTSSNQILAPIQAAVSLSASELSSAEASNSEEVKALESADLVVEKQTLEKQPVLKTTIDIQKSIPFEIPHQENSYEENEESQTNSNDQNSTPYEQGEYLPIHQSINDEFSKIDNDPSLQSVRSQFLQQVYSAYKSLANNPNASPYTAYTQVDSASHKDSVPEPTPSQPPKKLYYIYLQGYNPGTHRYAPSPQYSNHYQNVQQQGLDANYGNQLAKPIAALPPGSFSHTSANIYRHGEPNLNLATFINHGNLGQSMQYNRFLEAQPTINYAAETNQDSNPNPVENHDGQYSNNENHQSYDQQQLITGKDESHRVPMKVQYLGGSPQNLNHLNALSAENFHKYLDQTAKANGESNQNGFNAAQETQFNDQVGALSQNQDINGLRINNFLHSKFLEGKLKLQQTPTIGPTLPVVPQAPVTWPHILPLSRVAHLPYLQPYLPMSQIPIAPYKHALPYPLTHYLPLPNTVPQVPTQGNHPPTVYNRNDEHENPKKEGQQAPFRPSQKLYHSVYPPEMYYVAEYMRPNARSRGLGKKLCIEYGGFKPPLIPSVQIDEKLEVNIGKRSDKTD